MEAKEILEDERFRAALREAIQEILDEDRKRGEDPHT